MYAHAKRSHTQVKDPVVHVGVDTMLKNVMAKFPKVNISKLDLSCLTCVWNWLGK